MCEKALRQVLSFMNCVSTPARIAIERRPVNPTKFQERFLCSLSSLQYNAPMGGLKSGGNTL